MKVDNKAFRHISLIIGLLLITIILNSAVLSFSMVYFEQSILYVANQSALTFKNLLQLYLHPQLLHCDISFFRPSGHYLIYYLLVPLLGWHNTQGFLLVNLLFLALSGWLMVRIYALLFPRMMLGGLLAFAIYLMHPAMMLSKLSVMHFEYAYVFFSLCALYCFIQFSDKNPERITAYLYYCIGAIVFWVVATTFKEAALIMGPIMACYFILTGSSQRLFNKTSFEMLLMLVVVNLTLVFYITAPWPHVFQHPMRNHIDLADKMSALLDLIKFFFCWPLPSNGIFFRTVVNSPFSQAVMAYGGLLVLGFCLPVFNKHLASSEKRRMAFLLSAGLLCLILPINWAMALPWHLSLSIVFLSLLIGFSAEKFFKIVATTQASKVLTSMAVLVASLTLVTNEQNIHYYQYNKPLALNLNKNAIYHPPKIQNKLTDDSIILVEDSLIRSAYIFGDSFYPFVVQPQEQLLHFYKEQNSSNLVKLHPVYNGSLFKYAYLKPNLREEEYPFSIENMAKVPDVVLYNWVQNAKHILCLGYDERGHWHDKTKDFQNKLALEKQRRKLSVNLYKELSPGMWVSKPFARFLLTVDDPQMCQMQCDRFSQCRGAMVLTPGSAVTWMKMQCYLFAKVTQQVKPCDICSLFTKV